MFFSSQLKSEMNAKLKQLMNYRFNTKLKEPVLSTVASKLALAPGRNSKLKMWAYNKLPFKDAGVQQCTQRRNDCLQIFEMYACMPSWNRAK